MLANRRVLFMGPGADCYVSPASPAPKLTIEDPNAHWRAPVSAMMGFVRAKWPAEANDKDTPELTYYFYELAGLIWVGKDGKLTAS